MPKVVKPFKYFLCFSCVSNIIRFFIGEKKFGNFRISEFPPCASLITVIQSCCVGRWWKYVCMKFNWIKWNHATSEEWKEQFSWVGVCTVLSYNTEMGWFGFWWLGKAFRCYLLKRSGGQNPPLMEQDFSPLQLIEIYLGENGWWNK